MAEVNVVVHDHEDHSQRKLVTLSYIDDAIPDDLPNGKRGQVSIADIPADCVQDVLNALWDQLDPRQNAGSPTLGVKTGRKLPPHAIRRLATKLAVTYNLLPVTFYLSGVKSTDTESVGSGFFADIYMGEWKAQKVALKRLRVDTRDPDAHKLLQKQFCRESVLWREMHHEHVLPFLGVSKDAFSLAICMVLPWMENGNIRKHMVESRREGRLSRHNFVVSVNRWLYQVALGLVYLHDEGVIHGDLHGGNILVNDAGDVVLTDFGMGLLAEATPGNYGSIHGGGAYQFKAPELHDAEEFGLEDTRPTVASDVYSLAMVSIELYTDRLPFDTKSTKADYTKVCTQILNGGRPLRPHSPDNELMSAQLWEVVNRCWSHQPTERLSSHEAARNLKVIVDSDLVPTVSEKAEAKNSAPASPAAGNSATVHISSPSAAKDETTSLKVWRSATPEASSIARTLEVTAIEASLVRDHHTLAATPSGGPVKVEDHPVPPRLTLLQPEKTNIAKSQIKGTSGTVIKPEEVVEPFEPEKVGHPSSDFKVPKLSSSAPYTRPSATIQNASRVDADGARGAKAWFRDLCCR